MPSIIFLGKVLPHLPAKFSLGVTPYMVQPWPEAGGTITLVLNITASIIMIRCEVQSYDSQHQGKIMYDLASSMANTAVALIGFSTGYGLTAYLETITEPGEKPQPMMVHNQDLADQCTAYSFITETDEDRHALGEMILMVMQDPELYPAFHDLNLILTRQDYSPIACGRVIDGLRKIVAPALPPKQGWPILQELLNVDSAYMRFVSDNSTNPRHGDRTVLPSAIIDEITHRTWAIMNRFLEYRKRIDGPLPISDFPMLLG